jgi:hypothetical protein
MVSMQGLMTGALVTTALVLALALLVLIVDAHPESRRWLLEFFGEMSKLLSAKP